jgi:hypothetical protein
MSGDFLVCWICKRELPIHSFPSVPFICNECCKKPLAVLLKEFGIGDKKSRRRENEKSNL